MMKKRYIAAFLVFILIFSLTACNDAKGPANNDHMVNEDNRLEDGQRGNIEEDVAKTPTKTNEEEVTLYFANTEYIETGNENLKQLMPEKRTIEYKDISIEEAIVKELMKEPENHKLSTVIPATIQLIDVQVSDSIAFVNFAQEGLYGGSMQESFTISQIVNSLVELDNVDKVQFLIDGDRAESLMGHFDIREPFEKIEN